MNKPTWRTLTPDETGALRRITTRLNAVQKALPAATGWERNQLLMTGLNLCGGRPLPYWLYMALCEALLASAPPPPKDVYRQYVMVALCDPEGANLPVKVALPKAVKLLKGSPAECGQDAIIQACKRGKLSLRRRRRKPQ